MLVCSTFSSFFRTHFVHKLGMLLCLFAQSLPLLYFLVCCFLLSSSLSFSDLFINTQHFHLPVVHVGAKPYCSSVTRLTLRSLTLNKFFNKWVSGLCVEWQCWFERLQICTSFQKYLLQPITRSMEVVLEKSKQLNNFNYNIISWPLFCLKLVWNSSHLQICSHHPMQVWLEHVE